MSLCNSRTDHCTANTGKVCQSTCHIGHVEAPRFKLNMWPVVCLQRGYVALWIFPLLPSIRQIVSLCNPQHRPWYSRGQPINLSLWTAGSKKSKRPVCLSPEGLCGTLDFSSAAFYYTGCCVPMQLQQRLARSHIQHVIVGMQSLRQEGGPSTRLQVRDPLAPCLLSSISQGIASLCKSGIDHCTADTGKVCQSTCRNGHAGSEASKCPYLCLQGLSALSVGTTGLSSACFSWTGFVSLCNPRVDIGKVCQSNCHNRHAGSEASREPVSSGSIRLQVKGTLGLFLLPISTGQAIVSLCNPRLVFSAADPGNVCQSKCPCRHAESPGWGRSEASKWFILRGSTSVISSLSDRVLCHYATPVYTLLQQTPPGIVNKNAIAAM